MSEFCQKQDTGLGSSTRTNELSNCIPSYKLYVVLVFCDSQKYIPRGFDVLDEYVMSCV